MKTIYIDSLGDGYTDLIVELNQKQFTSVLAQIKEQSSCKFEQGINIPQHSFCYLDNEGFSHSSQNKEYKHYFF